MGHQGDTISMNTHLKALAKERKKLTKLTTEIEKLVDKWNARARRMVYGDSSPQTNIPTFVADLMGLLSEKAGVREDKLLSPCHKASIDFSRADGVNVGSCSVCGKQWVRQNPRTRITEWLDNYHPQYEGDLRPVILRPLAAR